MGKYKLIKIIGEGTFSGMYYLFSKTVVFLYFRYFTLIYFALL